MSKQTVEQTVESPAVWEAMSVMWRHCNVDHREELLQILARDETPLVDTNDIDFAVPHWCVMV